MIPGPTAPTKPYDQPREDRVPCRGCYLALHKVGDAWEHLNETPCTEPAPFTLAEWEAAYALQVGTTVEELHQRGVHAEVCGCSGEIDVLNLDAPPCTGFVLVDVHACALWHMHRIGLGLPVPPPASLW